MNDKSFYSAKKIYNEIAKLCLFASFEYGETDCFKIYESIDRKCYNLLIMAKNISQKEKLNEADEIKNLNENIFKSYYQNNNGDDDYQKNVNIRAKLLEWKENTNAYENLKAFSGESTSKDKLSVNDIVNTLKEVLSMLKDGDKTENTPKRIILLLDGAL